MKVKTRDNFVTLQQIEQKYAQLDEPADDSKWDRLVERRERPLLLSGEKTEEKD